MTHKRAEEAQINELLDENKKLRDGIVKYAEMAQGQEGGSPGSSGSPGDVGQAMDLAGQVSQLTMWNRQLLQALRDSHINYPLEWDMQASRSEAAAKHAQDMQDAAYQHMRQSLYNIYSAMLMQIRDVFSNAFVELEGAYMQRRGGAGGKT